MKNTTLLLLLSLFLSTNLYAQVWWTNDSKWVFGHENTGYPIEYLEEVYVDGVEVINNIECKVLKSKSRLIDFTNSDTTYQENVYGYAYVSGNKAWCLHDGDFILIYDFDLNVGEMLTLPLDDGTTIDLEVDEILEEMISGQSRKVMNMRVISSNCSPIDGAIIKIIEGIGVDAFLLEGYQGPFVHRMFDCFIPDPFNQLMCYTDSNIIYPEGANCVTLTSISDIEEELAFEVFPNPTVNQIQFNNNTGTSLIHIEIYNKIGQLVVSDRNSKHSINVRHLESGTYFMKLYFENGQMGIKRFIKM